MRPFARYISIARVRGFFRRVAYWFVVSLASTACVASGDRSDPVVRSDSAGVALVENGPTDRVLDWTFERILDLGGEDDGPTAFFRVFPTSIGVDSSENLYVLDAGRYTVFVFDRNGRLVRSFGRRGDGPGELSFPSDMAVASDGEAAIYDFNRRSLVLFDSTGSYTGTFGIPGPLQRQVVLLESGGVAAAVTQPSGIGDSSDYRLFVLGSDTTEIASVRQTPPAPSQPLSCVPLALPPYLGPRVIWGGANPRLAVSDDATYSIRIFEGARLASIWRRDLPQIRSTLELAAWEVAEGDSLRIRGCAVPPEEAATTFGYADVAPTITSLAVAPDGGVWVQRRTEVPGERPIDVFDSSGAYMGTLPAETPFPALFRADDEIVTVEPDELGVPHVVVYRILPEP